MGARMLLQGGTTHTQMRRAIARTLIVCEHFRVLSITAVLDNLVNRLVMCSLITIRTA